MGSNPTLKEIKGTDIAAVRITPKEIKGSNPHRSRLLPSARILPVVAFLTLPLIFFF